MDELLILEVLLRLLSLLVSCVGCYMLYEVLLRCKDLIQALCKVQWLFQSLHFVTIMVFFPSKKQLDCFTMNWSVPAIFGHFLATLPAILLSASNGSQFLLSLRQRFLFRRVCPKNYHMFHCIARYELYFSVSKNEIKMCCLPE
jgi:hypothetical protein